MQKYEESMKKYEENMKKYEGIMKKYVETFRARLPYLWARPVGEGGGSQFPSLEIRQRKYMKHVIHRLVSLPCTPSAFDHELAVIEYIAGRNELHININNIVRKKIVRNSLERASSPIFSFERKKFLPLPYLPPPASLTA